MAKNCTCSRLKLGHWMFTQVLLQIFLFQGKSLSCLSHAIHIFWTISSIHSFSKHLRSYWLLGTLLIVGKIWLRHSLALDGITEKSHLGKKQIITLCKRGMGDTYGDTVTNSVGRVREHIQRKPYFCQVLNSESKPAQLRRQDCRLKAGMECERILCEHRWQGRG